MRLAFCILLVLPIFHFALAAPVAVGEMMEVRSNAISVRKDEMAAWKKRMDSDDDDYAMSAVEGEGNNSGSDADDEDDDEDTNKDDGEDTNKDDDMDDSDTEGMSDARDTDAKQDDADDSDESDSSKSDGGSKSDSGSEYDVSSHNSEGGYEADGTDDNDLNHSGHDSSFASLDPITGPGVTAPATPERTPDLEKIISALTNLLTFGSRVTARASGVIDRGAGNPSVRNLPVHRQNRKK
jgi:hypothetical protein